MLHDSRVIFRRNLFQLVYFSNASLSQVYFFCINMHNNIWIYHPMKGYTCVYKMLRMVGPPKITIPWYCPFPIGSKGTHIIISILWKPIKELGHLHYHLNTSKTHLRTGAPTLWSQYFGNPFKNWVKTRRQAFA